MSRAAITCATLLLASVTSLAASWRVELGGADAERSPIVVAEAPQGPWLFAATRSFDGPDLDLLVVRLDRCGRVVASERWGDPGVDEEPTAALRIPVDGSHVVVGTRADGAAPLTAWARRLLPDGSESWAVRFEAAEDLGVRAVTRLADGRLLVAGEIGGGDTDGWFALLDASGTLSQAWRIAGAGLDALTAAEATADGGGWLAGWTESFGATLFDGWSVRIDANGQLVHSRIVGGDGDDVVDAIVTTNGDGATLAGRSDSTGFGLFDAWQVDLDPAGAVAIARWSGGTDDDAWRAIARGADGSTLALGPSLDPVGGAARWMLSGPALFPSVGLRAPTSVDAVAGGWLLAGTTSAAASDVALARVDAQTATGCDAAAPALAEASGVPDSALVVPLVSPLTLTPSTAVSTASAVSLAVATICEATPDEVSPPGVEPPLTFDDATTLSWEAASASCSNSFRFYRGELATLGVAPADCIEAAIAKPTAQLAAVPSPGSGWYLLVSGQAAGSVGTAGSGSSGSPRPVGTNCP